MTGRLLTYLTAVLALAAVSCQKDPVSPSQPELKTLGTPVLSASDNRVVWDSIPESCGYKIRKDSVETGLGAVTYADLCELYGLGEHTVSVAAVGDGLNTRNSEWSSPLTLTVEGYSFPVNKPEDCSAIADHPRLFLSSSSEELIRQSMQKSGNEYISTAYKFILSASDEILTKSVISRSWSGSMLYVAREALRRIFYLSFSYRMTGLEKYAYRAQQEMTALAAFDDWNPSHYLDVGEATLAMAIGFDWCYSYLTPSTRKSLAERMYALSLSNDPTSYSKSTNNWNPVCVGGSLCGAIAVYEEYPERCTYLINACCEGLQNGLDWYGPDGAYREGYTYWGYGTAYEAIVMDALRTAYGLDSGIPRTSGFLRSSEYRMFTSTPGFGVFAYGDAAPDATVCSTQPWFASYLGDPSRLWETRRMIDAGYMEFNSEDRFLPLLPLRVAESGMEGATAPQKNTFVATLGEQPIYIWRQNWTDSTAAYLGAKGGDLVMVHGHMDVGMFYFERNGVRWAADCGTQSYGPITKMLSDFSQNGERWKIFRYGPAGHNILQFGSENQKVDAAGTIVETFDEVSRHGCVIDLDDIYSLNAEGCRREVWVDADANLNVIDCIKGVRSACTLHWNMISRSSAGIQPDGSILLTKGGHSARLECAVAEAVPYILTASPVTKYDVANPDMVRVGFNLDLSEGKDYTIPVTITVIN